MNGEESGSSFKIEWSQDYSFKVVVINGFVSYNHRNAASNVSLNYSESLCIQRSRLKVTFVNDTVNDFIIISKGFSSLQIYSEN